MFVDYAICNSVTCTGTYSYVTTCDCTLHTCVTISIMYVCMYTVPIMM